jgi:hypothetical protein
MPDGAAPQTIKRKRDLGAKARIAWAMRREVMSTIDLTMLGFQLMSRREQLRRIQKQLRREGVPESEMPTARQLHSYWQEHPSLDGPET